MLAWLMSFGKWAVESGPNFLAALSAVFVSLIALFMMIPGEQPEKFLQSVVDFLAKWSKKPAADPNQPKS